MPNPEDDEIETFDGSEGEIATEPCPSWLRDLRRSNHRTGFYQALGNHALVFVDRDSANLIVSFDNLSSVRDDVVDRDPWGYGFASKFGWSHLGVMAFRPDWFRDPKLFREMRRLADEGFFRRFRDVTLTGTSMGAYAACAFASLVPDCKVIAYSPQSTLKKKLVPWEKRFSSGRKADWSGPFADAAAEIGAAAQVWLVYDPFLEEDRIHAERFSGKNVRFMRMRHAGHKTALTFRRAGLLSDVTRDVVENRMTDARFYAAYRASRRVPWFLNEVADRAAARGRPDLIARLVLFLRRNGQGFAAHGIRKRYLVGTPDDPIQT